jgi:hypothetical protein
MMVCGAVIRKKYRKSRNASFPSPGRIPSRLRLMNLMGKDLHFLEMIS